MNAAIPQAPSLKATTRCHSLPHIVFFDPFPCALAGPPLFLSTPPLPRVAVLISLLTFRPTYPSAAPRAVDVTLTGRLTTVHTACRGSTTEEQIQSRRTKADPRRGVFEWLLRSAAAASVMASDILASRSCKRDSVCMVNRVARFS